jgi:hypothetical protein
MAARRRDECRLPAGVGQTYHARQGAVEHRNPPVLVEANE